MKSSIRGAVAPLAQKAVDQHACVVMGPVSPGSFNVPPANAK